MSDRWTSGNAAEDTVDTRGWLVGHFVDPTTGGPRSCGDVEVKWGVHRAGESRHAWTEGDARTTLVVLIAGEFRVDLSGGATTLARQGDYVMWGSGVDHSWQALTDSVVLTVRWPSSPKLAPMDRSG